jgi:hypothetical protein
LRRQARRTYSWNLPSRVRSLRSRPICSDDTWWVVSCLWGVTLPGIIGCTPRKWTRPPGGFPLRQGSHGLGESGNPSSTLPDGSHEPVGFHPIDKWEQPSVMIVDWWLANKGSGIPDGGTTADAAGLGSMLPVSSPQVKKRKAPRQGCQDQGRVTMRAGRDIRNYRFGSLGRVKVKVLPPVGLFSAQIRPPCRSTTCLAKASPRPVPSRSVALALSAL